MSRFTAESGKRADGSADSNLSLEETADALQPGGRTRRTVLKTVGAVGIAGLAGCSSESGGESTSRPTETDTPTATDTPTETPTPTPRPYEDVETSELLEENMDAVKEAANFKVRDPREAVYRIITDIENVLPEYDTVGEKVFYALDITRERFFHENGVDPETQRLATAAVAKDVVNNLTNKNIEDRNGEKLYDEAITQAFNQANFTPGVNNGVLIQNGAIPSTDLEYVDEKGEQRVASVSDAEDDLGQLTRIHEFEDLTETKFFDPEKDEWCYQELEGFSEYMQWAIEVNPEGEVADSDTLRGISTTLMPPSTGSEDVIYVPTKETYVDLEGSYEGNDRDLGDRNSQIIDAIDDKADSKYVKVSKTKEGYETSNIIEEKAKEITEELLLEN